MAKTSAQLDREIAHALVPSHQTYWRIQDAKDPLAYDWESQIGLDDDDLGVEEGTSAMESLDDLKKWARGGHANFIGKRAVIEFEGEYVGRGSDGESIVRPTRELNRYPIQGGRATGDLISDKIGALNPRTSMTMPTMKVVGAPR